MRNPKTLLFVIGLFVQTCLSENVETTKQERNADGKGKKVSKREYYAPEYNHDHYKYPAYRFEYGVHDPQTGDIKKQYEEREGDTVRGYYSLMEPDGSIRLVEYTADSKNGFQAVVKKIGNSHHPTMTVTQHLNTAAGHHDGGDGGGGDKYAPNYHGGDHHDHHKVTFAPIHNGNYERPAHQQQHFDASPPAYNNFNEPSPPHQAYGDHYHQQPPPSAYNHYEPPLVPAHHGQYQQPSPSPAYNNHFEPQPIVAVNSNNHFEPQPAVGHYQPSPAYNHFEPQPVVPGVNGHHYEPPAAPVSNHYEPAAPVDHYEPAARPETADFEHGSAAPLFAGGLPTAHGDYGSASPEEYYPAPLHFPAASRENDFDWSAREDVPRVNAQDDYRFPASGFPPVAVDQGGAAKAEGGSVERPEYLRKYFEPNYRGNAAVSSFYDDDDESK